MKWPHNPVELRKKARRHTKQISSSASRGRNILQEGLCRTKQYVWFQELISSCRFCTDSTFDQFRLEQQRHIKNDQQPPVALIVAHWDFFFPLNIKSFFIVCKEVNIYFNSFSKLLRHSLNPTTSLNYQFIVLYFSANTQVDSLSIREKKIAYDVHTALDFLIKNITIVINNIYMNQQHNWEKVNLISYTIAALKTEKLYWM